MDSFASFMRWEIFRLGEASVTLGQVVVTSLTIILALGLAAWLIRRISQQLLKADRDANQVQLINRVLWLVVIATLFFTALSMLNVPLGAFAFISGAIAIGIGFGAQNIINNFISGWILMGVAYGSPVRLVAELIEKAVTEQDDVLSDPEPRVLFQDFGNSALQFEAYFWTKLRPGGDFAPTAQ